MKRDKTYVEGLLRPFYGLANTEVAKVLGVTAATVGNWRKKYSIPRGSLFANHFDDKYGEWSCHCFETMLQKGESYAAIGRVFLISRERARQIAVQHFGHKRGGGE